MMTDELTFRPEVAKDSRITDYGSRITNYALPLLLAAYIAIAALYATLTPPWQAPDEPAHYNYVRQLAHGELPVIEAGDYDQAYQQEVISSGFDPSYSVASFKYEDWQPPLYYLLLTPLFWLSGGSLLTLRLASALLGAGVVALAYAVARQVRPDAPWLPLTAAAFVAFLPQHVAIMASVNNDALAELLIAAILLALIGYVAAPVLHDRHALALGLLLGLGFLTKGTVYLMMPLVGLALLWRHRSHWRQLARQSAIIFGLALLLGLPWWTRNALVYGDLDIIGIAAHDAVVTGQPRTAEWLAQYGPGGITDRFLRTSFQSFWGQFGWMGVPMPGWIYQILTLFTLLTVAGLLLAAARPRQHYAAFPMLLLLGTLLLTLALYLGYNMTFVQHQGRYLFPALIPLATGVAIAWGTLASYLRLPPRLLSVALPLGLALALLGLDLLALFRFILPELNR